MDFMFAIFLFFPDALAFTMGGLSLARPLEEPPTIDPPVDPSTIADTATAGPLLTDSPLPFAEPSAFDQAEFDRFMRNLKQSVDLGLTNVASAPQMSTPINTQEYIPFGENVTLDASSSDQLPISFQAGSELMTSPSRTRNRYSPVDLDSSIPAAPVQLPVKDFCRKVQHGSYGNPNYQCQVYHVCQDSDRADTLHCPKGLKFNDETGICDWPQQVTDDCKTLRQPGQPAAMHMKPKPNRIPITIDRLIAQNYFPEDLELLLLASRRPERPMKKLSPSRSRGRHRLMRYPHWRQVASYSPGPDFPNQPFAYVNYPVYLGYKMLRKRLTQTDA